MSLVDHSVNSSSRRVRWVDWKTQRRSRAYFPAGAEPAFASRNISTGMSRVSSGISSAWMASAMLCHWTASAKVKEKSRSTAWKREISCAVARRSGSR